MSRREGRIVLIVAVVAVLAAPTAFSAGFGIFEQGTKAMGMAGAFTATADDGSAMFHNPAGLAFQDGASFYAGPTLISAKSDFDGADPFPGSGTSETQADAIHTPVSLYYSRPLNADWVWGLAVNTPFGLATEWDDPDNFSGRFISQRAEVQSISIQPTIALKVTDRLGLGLGLEYRTAGVELQRNQGAVNPYTQRVVDIAHIQLESDGINGDWGFTAGLLYKFTDSVRLGLSYRHSVDVDIEGKGHFSQISTGYADFDAAVAAQLPFGSEVDVETALSFPSMASFGFAVDPTPDLTVELNANWTGWNRFEEVTLVFPDHPELNSTIPEEWENVWNFRLGIEHRYPASGYAVRLGFVYDQTPQPRWGSGPLLPDGDRAGYTIGAGKQGANWGWDVAYMYLDFRTVNSFGLNEDGYNGVYDNTAHLLGLHLRYQF